ncbi:MAG: (E)-4-hydroxy-3-methylbut-2-enyl-diphosphate synthase [Bacteroidetes bacterium]|nr:(E)-4-hydroxy-3-methylbut-2-enyl-diphosphate synthase [Bacteroidota bacterium]MBS1931562.1 (E)-4-hydroxy-3-methylbut-2-enyl-diphosphate synthase [Bacteroidota bacterium]
MQYYCESLTGYKRLPTKEVRIGDLLLGNYHPIRVQTMTTTDTMDTMATVEQSIRCIEAGSELIRITAPSKNEAENLLNIKNELRKRGYHTPIVADIHFTPKAAEIAARIVEKVRINPGNYVDKKKFEVIDYSDAEYYEEIERIRLRFTPLINICKEYGTAMRIGTNHGSLSDRIMSRYGDTPIGMVESAMEFLRIARDENYHEIVLSMKASNPLVMVQAYRLLVKTMFDEFGECYPLHLGVTEAGDGEDGRIKSATGIGTLLEDGLGDTIRVSLTEDPEKEIPVCMDLVKRYSSQESKAGNQETIPQIKRLLYSPFEYKRRETIAVDNIGGQHVPVVIADLSKLEKITPEHLQSIGYTYNEETDKWNISDAAADYIFCNGVLDFEIPGTLKVINYYKAWQAATHKEKYFPILDTDQYLDDSLEKSSRINFVMLDCYPEECHIQDLKKLFSKIKKDNTAILCFSSKNKNAMQSVRRMFAEIIDHEIKSPIILITDSNWQTPDEHLIHYSAETGALFLEGMGDGICLGMTRESYNLQMSSRKEQKPGVSGRNYLSNQSVEQFMNNTAFGILQATRTRISKTEYISCPSCGRTLFDLQETTAKIRSRTHHLKGVKIAIMGCIVNGPGEMADADFGYVGSGPGKITLYKGKEIVKRNVNSEVAVDELIVLLKESGAWVDV